jgi:hypothetical protein
MPTTLWGKAGCSRPPAGCGPVAQQACLAWEVSSNPAIATAIRQMGADESLAQRQTLKRILGILEKTSNKPCVIAPGRTLPTVKDATGATNTRSYDLRVVAAPPNLLASQVVLKSGQATNAALPAANGTGALSWTLVSGSVPAGISFLTNGVLSGTPTADASELNETGLYTNLVQVADSFTDRVTGQPRPRISSGTVTELVRLSYSLNIHVLRTDGPYLGGICTDCHGSFFPPDLVSSSALALINVQAGSGGECSSSYSYIQPGNAYNSLVFLKVLGPPCGQQMPLYGPYLDGVQINRIARWINELTDKDDD